jgi:hypothetical protein
MGDLEERYRIGRLFLYCFATFAVSLRWGTTQASAQGKALTSSAHTVLRDYGGAPDGAQYSSRRQVIPAMYEVDGREYIAFCAAARATTYTHNVPGHAALQAPINGAYVVFALPETTKRP